MSQVWPRKITTATVWHKFERTKNGKTMHFFVQDVTDDMKVFLVEHMAEQFTQLEPLCQSLGVHEDKESYEGIKMFWREILDDNMSIICFEEDPNKPNVPLNFVGCNVLYVARKDQQFPEIVGEKWKTVFDAVDFLMMKGDEIQKDGVYLGAMGLSVVERYQGMSIGQEILNARTPLCKAFDLPMTKTVFTNISSQKLAERCGFKEIIAIDYDDLRKVDDKYQFNIKSTKSIKLMYKNTN